LIGSNGRANTEYDATRRSRRAASQGDSRLQPNTRRLDLLEYPIRQTEVFGVLMPKT
jgi:hypothetical protein